MLRDLLAKGAAAWTVITLCTLSLFAQTSESFDMVTFTPPKGWTRDIATNEVLRFTGIDNDKKTYCSIIIYRSTASKANIQEDFKSEWEELVVKNYHPEGKPQTTPLDTLNGWTIQSGSAQFNFNNTRSVVLLMTMSGYSRCTSIVTLTNSTDYQPIIDEFFRTLTLNESPPLTSANSQPLLQQQTNPQALSNENQPSSITSMVGTFGSTLHSYIGNYVCGYIKVQYQFLPDGTYSFIRKTFDCGGPVVILEKENGQYQFQGNNLTVTPKEGITEEWLKVNSFDEYGDFKSSSPRTLEKTTYTINSHHFSGSGETAIIFQSTQPTVRDGKPSTVGGFTDAWAYYPLTKTSDLIVLPATRKK